MARTKEGMDDLWLSIISSFERSFCICTIILWYLKANSVFIQSMECFLQKRGNVIRVAICRNSNIFVVNNWAGSTTSTSWFLIPLAYIHVFHCFQNLPHYISVSYGIDNNKIFKSSVSFRIHKNQILKSLVSFRIKNNPIVFNSSVSFRTDNHIFLKFLFI